MIRITVFTSLLVVAAAGCGDSSDRSAPDAPVQPPTDGGPPASVRVSQDITTDTTWVAATTYILPRLKPVFVTNNATLTIEPGTVVQGEQGSVLVITRGAKINAAGTVDKPILLTSSQPSGQKTPGWWGGLLVLGKAPINTNVRATPPSSEATFEAFTSAIPEGKFGGTDPHDNSGAIKYVRIEFAGFNFVADREFNNLTLCGVGDATTVDFVQVHQGSDDGIELFGGTVNVKHIVSSQNQDDGFDTDNGWQGKAQFIVVQNVSHPATLPEASNGYESDNHGTAASYTAEPRTLPTVSNVTLIGDHDYVGTAHFAAVFRRGAGGHYVNHLWYGFHFGPEIRDAETEAQAMVGNLTVQYSMFYNNDGTAANLPPPQATGDIDEAKYLTTAGAVAAGLPDPHNQFNIDPGMPAGMLNKTAPDFKPAAGAAALAAGTTPPDDPFFDRTATFAGAIGTIDWTAGWTKYPQN